MRIEIKGEEQEQSLRTPIKEVLSEWLPKLAPEIFQSSVQLEPFGQGSTNFAYLATSSEKRQLVVRVNTGEDRGGFQSQRYEDPKKPSWSQYHKEAYWQDRIRSDFPELMGVVPEVIAVLSLPRTGLPNGLGDKLPGERDELSISIQSKVEGIPADKWNPEQRKAAFKKLGKVAAKIYCTRQKFVTY